VSKIYINHHKNSGICRNAEMLTKFQYKSRNHAYSARPISSMYLLYISRSCCQVIVSYRDVRKHSVNTNLTRLTMSCVQKKAKCLIHVSFLPRCIECRAI